MLKGFVATLLVITLGWKLAVHHDNFQEIQEKDVVVQNKIASFLVREHFTAVVIPLDTTTQMPMVQAAAGACRMLVTKASSDGADRDWIRTYSNATDLVFVVFSGRIYAEQPTLLTVLDHLWAMFQQQLGLEAEASPVFYVIATRNCDAERLPWVELGHPSWCALLLG
jgi:hypothetical protein